MTSADKYDPQSDLGWIQRIDVSESLLAYNRVVELIQRLNRDLDTANARADEAEAERDDWRDRCAAMAPWHKADCPPDPSPCLEDYKDDDDCCARCIDLCADMLVAAAREAVQP